MKTLNKPTKTNRGFHMVEFKDSYGTPCSLQQSSVILGDSEHAFKHPGTSAIWLGCDDADPKIMARKAHLAGLVTTETTGWVSCPISPEILLTTRMHLDREQVGALINHLQSWLSKGRFT